MITVTVTTLDGVKHVDETFDQEGIRTLGRAEQLERVILDVGEERVVVIPWHQVAEIVVEGAGSFREWATE